MTGHPRSVEELTRALDAGRAPARESLTCGTEAMGGTI